MSNPDSLNPIPVGRRGGPKPDREERVTVLDATPPVQADPDKPHTGGVQIEGTPGNFSVSRPSADVVRSAIDPAVPPAVEKALVQYFRYTGSSDRKFKMPTGQGRDGYSATMRPGKVISTLEYPLAQLKTQGFIPGRNLEPISAEEALAS